ncbi:MAG TPA: hypothetical protein VI997_10335 [Candidatus Thermoplasmatota archaeon]|nr:hypothetical protein [Candidatus Thermoplasmatota archaeon]
MRGGMFWCGVSAWVLLVVPAAAAFAVESLGVLVGGLVSGLVASPAVVPAAWRIAGIEERVAAR